MHTDDHTKNTDTCMCAHTSEHTHAHTAFLLRVLRTPGDSGAHAVQAVASRRQALAHPDPLLPETLSADGVLPERMSRQRPWSPGCPQHPQQWPAHSRCTVIS